MEHQTIKLPKVLVDEIEKIMKEHPHLGYVSSAEFIKECVRKVIKEDFTKKR